MINMTADHLLHKSCYMHFLCSIQKLPLTLCSP